MAAKRDESPNTEVPRQDDAELEDDPALRGRPVPDELTIDPEVTVYADESAEDEDPILRRLRADPDSVKLAGGDLDAAWDAGDAGDESVGGTMPTPDQDNVEELGEAAGVGYEPNEPLDGGEKVGRRDAERWELDPASAEDYEERARDMARKPAGTQDKGAPRR